MPFVRDIVGPQRPVLEWPPLVCGSLRRTSTIDTHPAGTGRSQVDLRARDVVVREPNLVEVLDEVRVRARLVDRVQVPLNTSITGFGPDGSVYLTLQSNNTFYLEKAKVR